MNFFCSAIVQSSSKFKVQFLTKRPTILTGILWGSSIPPSKSCHSISKSASHYSVSTTIQSQLHNLYICSGIERDLKKKTTTILPFHKERNKKIWTKYSIQKKLFSPRSRRLCSVCSRLDNACVPRSQKLHLPSGNPHWTTYVKFAACFILPFHWHPFF